MPGHTPFGGKKKKKNVIHQKRSVLCADGVCRRFSIKINLDDMFARAGQNSMCWENRRLGQTTSTTFPVEFSYLKDVPDEDPKHPKNLEKDGSK